MNRLNLFLYVVIIALVLPAAVFAEGESFNPPGWVGATMFALALILPAIAYGMMKGGD